MGGHHPDQVAKPEDGLLKGNTQHELQVFFVLNIFKTFSTFTRMLKPGEKVFFFFFSFFFFFNFKIVIVLF